MCWQPLVTAPTAVPICPSLPPSSPPSLPACLPHGEQPEPRANSTIPRQSVGNGNTATKRLRMMRTERWRRSRRRSSSSRRRTQGPWQPYWRLCKTGSALNPNPESPAVGTLKSKQIIVTLDSSHPLSLGHCPLLCVCVCVCCVLCVCVGVCVCLVGHYCSKAHSF
jgi:hypothetical protein